MSGELVRTVVIIIVAAVFVTLLRTRLPEYSFMIAVAVICIVLLCAVGNLFGAISQFRDLLDKGSNTASYFSVALKALGISYISVFAADVCRDFGMMSFAQTIEICGKIAIFVLSIPLVTSVLDVALKFVGL